MEATTQEQHVFERIQQHFAAGGEVLIATYTRATLYRPEHASWFFRPKGVYVQSGEQKLYVHPQYIHLLDSELV